MDLATFVSWDARKPDHVKGGELQRTKRLLDAVPELLVLDFRAGDCNPYFLDAVRVRDRADADFLRIEDPQDRLLDHARRQLGAADVQDLVAPSHELQAARSMADR